MKGALLLLRRVSYDSSNEGKIHKNYIRKNEVKSTEKTKTATKTVEYVQVLITAAKSVICE